MSGWIPIADVVERLQLSDQEMQQYSRLRTAIAMAIDVAGEMSTTFDARSRALVVTKLQEAEHWSIEILRVAAKTRSAPP